MLSPFVLPIRWSSHKVVTTPFCQRQAHYLSSMGSKSPGAKWPSRGPGKGGNVDLKDREYGPNGPFTKIAVEIGERLRGTDSRFAGLEDFYSGALAPMDETNSVAF